MKCRVGYCEKAQALRGLLCSDHWSLVPDPLKRAIWQEYRPGQTAATATWKYVRLTRRAVRISAERDRNGELDRRPDTGARRR